MIFIWYKYLLYKHQWNTRWAFARKLDIFTCENNMLSLHVKITLLLWVHNRSRLSYPKPIKVKWFGSSLVYRVEKNISLVRCAHSWNIFQHSKINFVSPRGHVISSIYLDISRFDVPAIYRFFWLFLQNILTFAWSWSWHVWTHPRN